MSDFQADLFQEFGITEDPKGDIFNTENTFIEGIETVKSSEIITPEFTVSEAHALFNQMFEAATPTIKIVGEVANFKINQGKWVFFDLKDADSALSCFMSTFKLRIAVEDGMKVAITARPNITKWGKLSLTVEKIRPAGKGSMKRASDLLREKLTKEGLFEDSRKRALPKLPSHIGVISSVDAAGYNDFIKILNARMKGIDLTVAHTQVQGSVAADQIRGALKWFNESTRPVEVIAILRGGGSRDDLIAFDDEKLVREISASRIPIITGIGHEVDIVLADLAADVRASTPSNAAEILVPDEREIIGSIETGLTKMINDLENGIMQKKRVLIDRFHEMNTIFIQAFQRKKQVFNLNFANLQARNPTEILRRNYAILRDNNGKIIREKPDIGDIVVIENLKYLIESEVKNVRKK